MGGNQINGNKKEQSVFSGTLFLTAAIIMLAGLILLVLFAATYGDGTMYERIAPTRHYIDPQGQHHVSFFLDGQHCGSVVDHIFGFRIVEVTVSKEVFDATLGNNPYVNIKYTCDIGQVKDIVWWAY